MMPCLHNYITVDTPAFLANPKNLELIYNMCKKVVICECVPSEVLYNFVLYIFVVQPEKSITYMCQTKATYMYMYIAGYFLFIESKEGLFQLI